MSVIIFNKDQFAQKDRFLNLWDLGVHGIEFNPNDADEEIENPYSREKCKLPPDAVAVYDVIRGCEVSLNTSNSQKNFDELIDLKEKCLSWFYKYFHDEYLKLLD